MKVSRSFKDRVLKSVRAGRESKILPGGIRLKLSLAGMAFVVAAASVFFIVGPQPGSVAPELVKPEAATQANGATGESEGNLNFSDDPTVKIESFPVPEGSRALELAGNDSLLKGDSTLRIDEFVLPVVEKSKENVNIKF
jgi:hypothetical protein